MNDWITNLETELIKLEKFADDKDFQELWEQIKHQNKIDLAHLIKEHTGIDVNPNSLFDVQVKRFHEYKRQHLNVLYIISLYNRIKKNPGYRYYSKNFHLWRQSSTGLFYGKAYY